MTALAAPARTTRTTRTTTDHDGGTPRRPRVRPVTPPARGQLLAAAAIAPAPLLRPGVAAEHPEPDAAPATAPAGRAAPALGDPTALVCAVVRGTVEALRGERSLAQLARWVTPSIMDALTTRAALVRSVPHATRATTVPRPVLVRRARVVRLGPTTAEATVVVDDVDRVRAAAVRVEVHRGHWRVVALEIG